MPASVHEILVHGADIVHGTILSIGKLSEETQESRNKDLMYFRKRLYRKTSRSSKNIFNLLLVSWDPIIWRLRKLSKKAKKKYLPKTLNLFAVPKESKDLICSDAAFSEGDTSEETN